MSVAYIARRFIIFLVVVWAAATFNFLLPRLGGVNPVREKLIAQASLSGSVQAGLEDMIAEFEAKFGIDQPLWKQYLTYMSDMARFDFNYSIVNYPRRVADMIAEALPWTISLLLITTLLAFLIGNFLGALMAWPNTPKFLGYIMPPILMMTAIPYFLLGLILVYVFGFYLGVFPLFGGYTPGTIPTMTWRFAKDVVWHSMLPALSILLVGLGFWAMGMRAMMVMTQGEDYVIYADAMGLRDRTIFARYAIRNALLPQVTALALSLGGIVGGAVLVEVIFGYPGIGTVLYQGIRGSDYYLVQGIVFVVIVSIGLATFILDIVYPLLDPRITYRRS
ncbi:MAG: ABC transporter permease [Caldilineaceae bacterium]|nr:ABC transporter permease [Caldilineaceae bacterium]